MPPPHSLFPMTRCLRHLLSEPTASRGAPRRAGANPPTSIVDHHHRAPPSRHGCRRRQLSRRYPRFSRAPKWTLHLREHTMRALTSPPTHRSLPSPCPSSPRSPALPPHRSSHSRRWAQHCVWTAELDIGPCSTKSNPSTNADGVVGWSPIRLRQKK